MLLNNNSLCEALPGFSYYICRNVLAAIENTSMLDRYLRILAYILARSAAVLPPRRSQHCAGNLQGEFTSSFGKLGASSSFRSLRHKIGSRFFMFEMCDENPDFCLQKSIGLGVVSEVRESANRHFLLQTNGGAQRSEAISLLPDPLPEIP